MSFVSCGFWATRGRLHLAILVDGRLVTHGAIEPERRAIERVLDDLVERQATLVLAAGFPLKKLVVELACSRPLHVMLAADPLVAALRTVAGLDTAEPHLSAALVARLAHLPLFLEHLAVAPRPPRCNACW